MFSKRCFDLIGFAYDLRFWDSKKYVFSCFEISRISKIPPSVFRYKNVGVADRIGPTQNPQTFINKSLKFSNIVDLVGFASVFILRDSRKIFSEFTDFQHFQESTILNSVFHEYPEKRRLFGTQENSYLFWRSQGPQHSDSQIIKISKMSFWVL